MHIDTRNPLGKINREIRHIGFLLRKFRGKLIFVSQRFKDVEGTFRDTDIWLATFHKLNKKTCILYANPFREPLIINNIPKTSIKYNTYDIAPFGYETYMDEEEQTFEQQILREWLKHGNYSRVAKQHNLYAQQVKRIVLDQVQKLLALT